MNQTDPKPSLEPFAPLIGEWSTEMTHPAFSGVVRGRARFEWLAGERFLIQRAETDQPAFPDSIWVIGVMEDDDHLSAQYFDQRGVHRVYPIGFNGTELRIWRDAPGFAQHLTAKLSADRSSLEGVWQLNKDDQGFRDHLAVKFRRSA